MNSKTFTMKQISIVHLIMSLALFYGITQGLPFYWIIVFSVLVFWRTFVRYLLMPIILTIITAIALIGISIKYAYDKILYNIKVSKLLKRVKESIDD